MSDFIKYMKVLEDRNFYLEGKLINRIYDLLECNDGFSMSVQASSNHYCLPREMLDIEDYTHFEIMCPDDDMLTNYNSGGVYSNVPKEVIQELIEKHGLLKDMKEEIETEKKALSKVIKRSGKLKKKKVIEKKRI